MTRLLHELLIFIVFLKIVLQACANIPEISDERRLKLADDKDDKTDFITVEKENIFESSMVDEEASLSKSLTNRGSYGNLKDLTTSGGGGIFFDSIFSDFTLEEETNGKKSTFLTPTIISETASEDLNEGEGEGDCFNGQAVDNFSMEWIKSTFIPYFQRGNQLLPGTLEEILKTVESIFWSEPTIVNIEIKSDEELIVVGDIHGQIDDLVRIFDQNGYPTLEKKFLFNGDIVDRGSNSIGCLMTLFLMKIYFPSSVYITRGNHESHTCGDGTFKEECFERIKEPLKFFLKCHDVFNVLPLAYIIQSRFFVCHGGLPDYFDLNFIRHAKKPNYNPEQQFLLMSMLWNDPHDGLGMKGSKRGGSTLSFGKDVTFDFLQRHNFDLLIRSHEYHMDGYFFMHDNSCLTIFSAPNYCGLCNKGTVMKIKPDLSYEIVEIVTPKYVENTSYKRTKERSWTLNLEESEEDVVIVFPIYNNLESIQPQPQPQVQVQNHYPFFSWDNFFS